jgi:hypothetical protein
MNIQTIYVIRVPVLCGNISAETLILKDLGISGDKPQSFDYC